jgi:Phosphotransferase enzyme family
MPLSDSLTLQDWPLIARAAGIDPAPYGLARTWIKDDRGQAHVTLAMTAPGLPGFVVKQIFEPDDATYVADRAAAQAQAAQSLGHHPQARVPPVVALDINRRVILMPLVAGDTLFALCDDPAAQPRALEQAGIWAAAFHAARPTEARHFQPRKMMDHLLQIAADVGRGTRPVVDPARWLAIVARIRPMAAKAQGAPTVSAVRHGDLVGRNLIADGDMVWGIDLSPVQTAPVGYDIARFLMDHMWTHARLAALRPGQLVSDPVRDAFFRGYRLIGPNDGTLPFLIAVRFALDWLSLPVDMDVAPVRRLLQYEHMREMARLAFDIA